MASSDENLDLAQLYALLEQSGRESEFPDLLRKASDQAASDLVANLKRRTPRMLRQHRRMRRRFERRLVRRWRKALRLYEMVMVAASEAGADFNQEHRPSAAEENDFVFEALVVIHARASRIASEVFALLRTGHADGAHTRWRTLHELAVVAYVISEHGEEVAERYLLHHLVQNEKDARTYKSNSAMLGQTPFSDEEMQEIEQGAQAVVDRFGSNTRETTGGRRS